MNFDITQDLSGLQNVRKSRGKGIRPGKPRAKPSAAAAAKPVEQRPAEKDVGGAAVVTRSILQRAQNSVAEGVAVNQSAEQPQLDRQQPVVPHVAPARSAVQAVSSGPAARVHVTMAQPAEQVHVNEPRRGSAGAGTSSRVAGRPLPLSISEPAHDMPVAPEAPDADNPPAAGDLPKTNNQRCMVQKRNRPKLGTNISKHQVKPRKKRKKSNLDLSLAPPPENNSAIAVASFDARAHDADHHMPATKAVVNQYDEMTRALCAGKRPRGKRKKIDPSAPIDPKNMTLMDVIRHAHSNANILDRQYKELKANELKDKEQAAAAGRADPPAPPEAISERPGSNHNPLAPQLVLRDGKIVVDQGSLTVQANAPVTRRSVEVEEDDDTLINSHSYLPVSKLTKERWTQQETELFYQILRSYGADFTFMSQCFQGRTRKQVKNKYLKEERVNPGRIKAAMSGSQTATLAQLTNLAQPGTAAADIAAILPDGEGDPGATGSARQERACAQDEDDECLGTAVDPTLADFFY
eukprot:jgi/Ulvmu1/4387/UM002_0112.1